MTQGRDSGTNRSSGQARATTVGRRQGARPEAMHYVLGFSLVLAAAAFVMVHHFVAG